MGSDEDAEKATRQKVLDAVSEIFHGFIDRMVHLHDAVRLTINGITSLQGQPALTAALGNLAKVRGQDDEAAKYQERMTNATRMADLARKEVDQGFPLIYAQAVVTLWSYVDDLVRATIARWLDADPELMKNEAVRKLRVKVGDILDLDNTEKCFHYVDMLDQELTGPNRLGVARYEALLAVFQLRLSVDEEVKRDLLTLHQVRNVIVHRNGVADRRVVATCPWLGLRPGDRIAISDKNFRSYLKAVEEYALAIIHAHGGRYGVEFPDRA